MISFIRAITRNDPKRYCLKAAAAFTAAAVVFCGFPSVSDKAYADSTVSSDFQAVLESFPKSYRTKLEQLHSAHPGWVFTPVKTGLDWNDVLNAQCVTGRNLVQSDSPTSWKSFEKGSYDSAKGEWIKLDGEWVGASRQIIAYYLDPRNFLDDSTVFMFENQSYNKDIHTQSGVENILKGSFMDGNYTCPDTGETKSYSQTFMEAAKISGVSPYHLASRCRNEQGTNGAPQSLGTAKGFEGYFNFFDINAYYTTNLTAGQMGAKFAKTENPDYYLPWTNQYKSIVGGAIFLGQGYINKGQDTLYQQKFDVTDDGNGLYFHQYMTCVFGQETEAREMKNAYSAEVLDSALEFKVPVYENMPESACEKPESEKSGDNLLDRLDVLKPNGEDIMTDFYRYTSDYRLEVPEDTDFLTVSAMPYSPYAKVDGAGRIELDYGKNVIKIKVTAQNGDERCYRMVITRKKKEAEPNRSDEPKKGDVNGDGKVDELDQIAINEHISGEKPLTGEALKRADVDENGNVEITDALTISQLKDR